MLIRIEAPHFVAGLVLDERGHVIEAAPILRWAMGRAWGELRSYFRRRGWPYARLS
jgi:hypothetical protein